MEQKKSDATHDEIEFEPYHVLPAGMYRCRLEAVSNVETQFGAALEFRWQVSDGDEAGESLTALANKKLLPKSKLATWAKAHLGVPAFPEGFILKLSTLIGKDALITVGVEPRSDGGGDRNVVRAVDPVKASLKKPAPVSKPPANEGFSDLLDEVNIPDPGDPTPMYQQRAQQ
jgi:hypothetical protein